ncbi:Hypothetical protein, putative [Bodo saltans]|uniref:Uncharacterized protein n=1 Tax=Bodo saltans TaxID=75058 RepID=A0A0S4KHN6_BODSA|nr:Hypothetical protein, putative [Bodo saltans]|eukprot:CUI14108.1 Hypothetical protein, putative [Bodo saltans]
MMILPLVGTRGQRSKSMGPVLSTNVMRTAVARHDHHSDNESQQSSSCMASRSLDRRRSISTKQDRYDVVSLSRICRVALNRNASSHAAVHDNTMQHHQTPHGNVMLPPLPSISPPLPLDDGCLSPHQKTATAVSSTATLRVGLSTLALSPCTTRPGTPQLSDDDTMNTNVALRGSPAAGLMRRAQGRGVNESSPSLHVKVPKHRRSIEIVSMCFDNNVVQGSTDVTTQPQLQNHLKAHQRQHKEDTNQFSEWLEGFCSLPLPEEMLPMDDAPVDVYRCVVLIQEHRSAQLSQKRAQEK